ncbi:MAG: resA 1 [Bacteroidetes bacterium]|nr:resA 1 [Bacteroidota bacterium]
MKHELLIFIAFLAFSSTILSQEAHDERYSKLEILDYPQSLSKLLKKFKGRVIYIDLMASWCKPCIVELKEAKKLQTFFESHAIVRLYITLDNKDDIDKCFQKLNRDTISGYFTSYHPIKELSGSTFPQEINSLFLIDENGNMNIFIPKYAIVNKLGEIVVRRAERPSNGNALKEQLKEYLK